MEHDFIRMENCIVNGYSLIDNVFGSGIVVYDPLGNMYTSPNNARLLARAQLILEDIRSYDLQGLAQALNELRDAADILDQAAFSRTNSRTSSVLNAASLHGDERLTEMAGAIV